MTLENNVTRYYAAMDLGRKAEGAIYGTRGAPKKREFIQARVRAIGVLLDMMAVTPKTPTQEDWDAARIQRQGRGLAREARMYFDEHGSTRGDYWSTTVLDYVAPSKSREAPFLDMGGGGLAVVSVTRKRVYARSRWYPHTSESRFLIGRNEAGTFFSHAIPKWCSTVEEAIDWIWGGRSADLVIRQGDIAIVLGVGPKMPKNLPSGHRVEGDKIVHATHPTIRMPGKGERIIVGRRVEPRVASESRD